MTRYVAGFLFYDGEQVALIQKQHPAWQHGLWNGIGGKIEEGETAADAMRREFREEAGVDIPEWEYVATLRGSTYEVVFFRAFSYAIAPPAIHTTTSEQVRWWPVSELPATLPNVRWLVQMARHEVVGRGMPFEIVENAA